jgi:hypothetical protein
MENVKMQGAFQLDVCDAMGNLKNRVTTFNTIMNGGKADMAALLLADLSASAARYDWVAIGTGNTAPNATQSVLVSEAYRGAGTGTRITTSVANDTARLSASASITHASIVIQEAGVFNAASSGTMLARATFSAITASSGDTVNTIYSIQFS